VTYGKEKEGQEESQENDKSQGQAQEEGLRSHQPQSSQEEVTDSSSGTDYALFGDFQRQAGFDVRSHSSRESLSSVS